MARSLSLKPVAASEALAVTLRDRILSGEIAPGTRLPELDLASQYGLARPTVREALQRLVHQGVLQRQPNHSAWVPELTPEAVADIFFARIPLEVYTVRTLIERGIEVPAAREAVARLQALADDAHWSEVVDADFAFHQALVTATASPRLSRLHASLEGEIRLCIAQLRPAWHTPSALAEEHRQVLEGILAGSVSAAEERMREHLEKAVRDLTVRARERAAPRTSTAAG
jgi:DNA-binding GntR family transcriptional regulator